MQAASSIFCDFLPIKPFNGWNFISLTLNHWKAKASQINRAKDKIGKENYSHKQRAENILNFWLINYAKYQFKCAYDGFKAILYKFHSDTCELSRCIWIHHSQWKKKKQKRITENKKEDVKRTMPFHIDINAHLKFIERLIIQI